MDVGKLIKSIEMNDSIENKEDIIEYIKNSLSSRVFVYDDKELDDIESLLKELEYDAFKFSRLLECSYRVKNAVVKEGKYKSKPSIEYIRVVKSIFDKLDMNYTTYNTYNISGNVAISKCLYSIMRDNGLINNEIDILETGKKILKEYYPHKDPNSSALKMLTILNRVNKGFRDMEEAQTGLKDSEEFLSLFEVTEKIYAIYLSDIVKEFYPKYKNALFTYIKKMAKEHEGDIKTEELVIYLRNIEETHLVLTSCKESLKKELFKYDIKTKAGVEKAFSTLLDTVKFHDSIDNSFKIHLLEHINKSFDNYKQNQEEFLDKRVDVFFESCLEYINIIINAKEQPYEIDDIVLELLKDSKDFFVEYDAKTFKEIVSYISDNTNISKEELKSIATECKDIFKDSSAQKLKSMHKSLKEFSNFVNTRFSQSVIEDNLFELILKRNPELLLKENRIEEITSILNGELPFKMGGYIGDELRIDKDFLTYDFYKLIKDDNYNLLFNGGAKTMANNLSYLSDICKKCDIDMKSLSVSERMLYTLLKDDFYGKGTPVVVELKSILNNNIVKFLIEKNPNLLMLKQQDMNLIVKRSLLNSNQSYDFYNLFISELYDYRQEDYLDHKEAIQKPFKSYDFDIDYSKLNFDMEELLTSSAIKDMDVSDVEDLYNKRQVRINRLNNVIERLRKTEYDEITEYYIVIKRILSEYSDLYSQVPNLKFKKDLYDTLDGMRSMIEQKIDDTEEEFSQKDSIIQSYKNELEDAELIDKELASLLDKLVTTNAKKMLKSIINNTSNKKVIDIRDKVEESTLAKQKLKKDMEEMKKHIQHLTGSLCKVEFLDDVSIDEIYEESKSFTIKDALEKNAKESLEDSLSLSSNVVVFADTADYNNKDFINDSDCMDKLYKFLVDDKFSIKSISFMRENAFSADVVEKYYSPREKLWSRRESRTPVRVYFFPVHTKYFTVYYVVNIDKDSVHSYGGMSDSVYKRHVLASEALMEKINAMSKEEALAYAKQAEKDYKEKVEPLVKRKKK